MFKLDIKLWRGFLRTHLLLIEKLDSDIQKRSGLSLRDWEALLLISRSEDGIRLTDLANAVLVSQGAITKLLVRLKSQKFISIEQAGTDKRSKKVTITRKGKEILYEDETIIFLESIFFNKLPKTHEKNLKEILELIAPGSTTLGDNEWHLKRNLH